MSNDVKKIYLCRPNLSPICQLNGVEVDSVSINKHVKDFDELSFTVDRYVNIDGKLVQSSGYDLLNVAMYLHVQDYGYFRMEYPSLQNDGTLEKKEITAYSAEKEVFNTDWVGLKINTAEEDSQEMLIDGNVTDYAMPEKLISFHNPYDTRFSLLNILISKVPLWSVGYVDPNIYLQKDDDGNFIQETKKSPTGQDIPQTFSYSGKWAYTDDGEFVYDDTPGTEPMYKLRSVGIYQEENISVYAFLTSSLGPKVGCLFFFDTENRVIHAVSKYSLEHDDAKYDTGIYIGFRNLANNVNLSVEEDSVVTRVNCAGGEGLNFLDLNYGSTRLYDLSYFAHEPYMTEETAAKVLAWQELIESKRAEYKVIAAQAIKINDEITDITYKVPADENYWKTWDGMNQEALNKSLAYYQNELAMLQESVDDSPRYDSNGKYIPYNSGKQDGWYQNKLITAGNGYGGYGTYYEIVTYIIPNIRIALNNLNLVSTDPRYQEPVKAVEYDWELYGIVELEAQIKNLTNQFDSIKQYYGAQWPSSETPAAIQIMASHAWNKQYYEKQRGEYLRLYNEIGPNGSAFTYLDSLYLKRDGTDRNGTPVSQQAVNNSLSGRLSALMNQMLPYKQYYELSNYFNEEDLSQIYPLIIDTDYQNTNIMMQETDTAATKIDVQQELLDDCLDKVSELSQPQISFSSDLDNLYRIDTFKDLRKDLKLLNYIHLAVRDDYVIKLRVVGIQWNPCDINQDLSLQFSNMITSRSGRSDFTDIINSENNRGQKNGITVGANGQIGGSGDSIDYLTNLMEALSGTGIFKKRVKDTVENPVTGVATMLSKEEFTAALKTVPGMSRFVLDSAQVAELESGDTVMSGGKIMTGFINAKYIAVDTITSSNYSPDSQSVFSLAGTKINLLDGSIEAKNFAIDSSGNATFKGTITTGSTIIGSTIQNAAGSGWTFQVNSSGTITSRNAASNPSSQTTISAGKITTNNVAINGGTLSIGGKFSVDASGNLTATSATITGTITSSNATITGGYLKVGTTFEVTAAGKLTSTSATIGGWNIDSDSIYYGTKGTGTSASHITLMSSNTFSRTLLGESRSNLKFAIGSRFGVDQNGTVYSNYLTARNVNISGTITASTIQNDPTNWTFQVSSGGVITSRNAASSPTAQTTISAGKITTNSVAITGGDLNIGGKFHVDTTGKLTASSVAITGGDLNIGSGKFHVDSSGNLTATSATITGTITATGGTIGGCSISGGTLYIPSANITGGITASAIDCVSSDCRIYIADGGIAIGNSSRIAFMRIGGFYDGDGYCVHSNGGAYAVSNLKVVYVENAGYYMQVSGPPGAFGVDMWSSDQSLKKDIRNTTVSALPMINSIKHRQFVWKKDGWKQQLGYVAQELEQAIPKSTFSVEQSDGTKQLQIRQSAIIPYITKSIQQLSAEVDLLKQENKKLKDMIQILNRR